MSLFTQPSTPQGFGIGKQPTDYTAGEDVVVGTKPCHISYKAWATGMVAGCFRESDQPDHGDLGCAWLESRGAGEC